MTTASTRLTGLIGYPVRHSFSPTIHTAALIAAGIDAVYVAFEVEPSLVETALDGLVAAGVWGLNATIPYKRVAYDYADDHTEEAQGVGVANTLFWQGDRLWADNTDATGLGKVFTDLALGPGDRIEIVGAGGAARAAAVAAGRIGATVTCSARRPDQATIIEDLARAFGGGVDEYHALPKVVINATPLGRNGEQLDSQHMALGPGRIALDLNYEGNSPFLVSTRAAGGTAIDGTGMLVAQAEASFARWFNQRPPSGIMMAALGQN